MTPSSSPESDSDPVFSEFLRTREEATDKEAHLEEWCALHPDREKDFRAHHEMERRLIDAGGLPDKTIPKQLGEYVLGRRISRSMGVVYQAHDPKLERDVAVKIIHPGRTSPAACERFEREQKLMAKLHQTNIVPIYAAGQVEEHRYFAMPFIHGATLLHIVENTRVLYGREGSHTPPLSELAALTASDRIQPTRPPSQTAREDPAQTPRPTEPRRVRLSLAYYRSVAQVIADAAEALGHVHDANVIHRDLKPANLMVDRTGHCWLIDFGLAGDTEEAVGTAPLDAARGPVTVSGVMGTPPYMAPEQWDGKADRRTDIYGLGVTMYELLTLRPAFQGRDEDMKRRVQTENPPRPRDVAANIHPDLEAICLKAMNKDITRRYQGPREFAADLRRWLAAEPTHARPPWPPRRLWLWARREPWRAAVSVLLLLLVLGGVVGAAAWQVKEERERARRKEYEANLLRLQQIRLGERVLGWSKIALDAGEAAARNGNTPELRSHVAAALLGLDGELIKATKGGASSLAFDKSGKRLLRGGREKEPTHLYDIAADRTTFYEQTGPGPVAFLADGTPAQLVASGGGWPVRLMDLPKNREIKKLMPPEKERRHLHGLALSADGAVAATVQGEREGVRLVHIWDLKAGKVIHSLEGPTVASLAFSPDGVQLAIGQDDGGIVVWSAKGAKSVTLSAGRLRIHGLAFGRDPHQARTGRRWLLASGDAGGGVIVWDLSINQVRTRCYGARHQVYSLAFSPDGMTLCSGGRRPLLLWNLATGRLLLSMIDSPDFIGSIAFSPDGTSLAGSSFADPFGYGWNIVWSLKQKREMLDLRGLTAVIAKVRFSRDGKRMAALSHSWEIGVWDLETGYLLHVLAAPPGFLADNSGLQFSPDGEELAYCAGRNARRWDVKSGRETARWGMPPGMVDRLLFEEKTGALIVCRVETRDGKRFPLADAPWNAHPRVVRFYQLRSGEEPKLIRAATDFPVHVFHNVASVDGSRFVLMGLTDAKTRRRLIKVFSPRGVVQNSFEAPETTGGFCADAGVNYLALVGAAEENGTLIVEALTRKLVITCPTGVNGVGLEVEQWFRVGSGPRGDEPGLELTKRGERVPFLVLDIDHHVPTGWPRFSTAGTHLAWGNGDGSVVVCSLPAVQKRLAAIGLGW